MKRERPSVESAVVLRPGALGDAVLTLPVLHALRAAGARELLILGQPYSWSFLAASAANSPCPASQSVSRKEARGPAVRVCDSGAPEWMGLFAAGVRLGSEARRRVASARLALVYLAPDRTPAECALREAGVGNVVGITPPLGAERAPPSVAPRSAPASGARADLFFGAEVCHAARRLLEPLREALGDEALAAGWRTLSARGQDDPLLAVAPRESAAALRSVRVDSLPAAGVLALHPGSGGRTKCWPAEHFARLARAAPDRGLTPLALFGPADAAARQAFQKAYPQCRQAVDLPLRELVSLLAASRAYVGNDSGVTHLAARLCPTLALFGPSDPRVWRPLGPRVETLAAPGGRMEELDFALVLSALLELLRIRS